MLEVANKKCKIVDMFYKLKKACKLVEVGGTCFTRKLRKPCKLVESW